MNLYLLCEIYSKVIKDIVKSSKKLGLSLLKKLFQEILKIN